MSEHPTPETRDGRHVLDSPVDLPLAPADMRRPWRWTTATIAAAALFLALFNAAAIGGWIDETTPGPISDPLRAPVAAWVAFTEAVGFDIPRAWLRRRWTDAQARRFGGEQPGQKGAAAGSLAADAQR